MKRKQSVMQVTILLDSVSGWGHEPEDHVEWLQRHLNSMMPHYKPTVELLRVEEVES